MKTPVFNIHDLILVLTLAVCLLLVVFQWLLSKQKAIGTYLLSGFFTCVGLTAFCNLLLWNDYILLQTSTAKALLALTLTTAIVGKGVCLYLYVVSITHENFTLTRRHALHLLNLVVVTGLIVAGNLDSDHLRFRPANYSSFSNQMTDFLWNYLKVLPVIYAFWAVWVIRQYKQQLKEFYSNLSLEGPYWLLLLTLGFAINWLWSLVVHVLGQVIDKRIADGFGIFDNYITFLLVNALFVYSIIYAHQLLQTKATGRKKEPANTEPSADVIERIQQAMEQEQLYLRQNLNIEEFARHLGIQYREVSNILNNHFNTNFFEFVNRYRVDHAKMLLLDPQHADTTIMEIFLESGFNSKSSFNRFFKRYTGMSAADFRKQTRQQ